MQKTAFLAAILLAAAAAWAQAAPPAPPSPNQSTAAAPQTSTPPAGSTPHRVLQAKSQEELKAYEEATSKTDAAQAEAAANAFAAKYPDSEMRATLYIRAMQLYVQGNNGDKVIETGRKAIALDPTNPVPLVQVGSTLAESTRDTDADREQRLAEAAKDAHAAIDNIDTGLLVPPSATPEQVTGAKKSILTMAYDTLGSLDMSRNDFASAVTNLQKAIDESKAVPEAVLYLRLSVAQDRLKQYPEALESANKAVQYAPAGSAAQNLAKQQQDRLQKLIASSSSQPAAAPSPTPVTTPPTSAPATDPGTSSTPH